jgi:tetratricopeptide (TPR) repeat protein
MKKYSIWLIVLILMFMQACKTPEQKLLERISELEKELFSELKPTLDREKAFALVNAYVEFAMRKPEDKKAVDFLFKAGDISMNSGHPERAIELFSRIYNDYPEYDKRPESLFLMGFVYENMIGNLPKAEETYRRFIELYPGHDLADDAEMLIEHLGKSPEELVREFEERMKLQ